MIQKLLFILLVSTTTYAQMRFVKVGYSLKIGYDEGLSNADGLKDYYAMAATLIDSSASPTPMTQQQFAAAYTANYNFCVYSKSI